MIEKRLLLHGNFFLKKSLEYIESRILDGRYMYISLETSKLASRVNIAWCISKCIWCVQLSVNSFNKVRSSVQNVNLLVQFPILKVLSWEWDNEWMNAEYY